MSGRTLRAALAEYLAVRRALGFKLARDGLLLEQFVSFCEQAGASRVTSELALAWVSAPAKASPGWLGMRLTIVRGFASWLQASARLTAHRYHQQPQLPVKPAAVLLPGTATGRQDDPDNGRLSGTTRSPASDHVEGGLPSFARLGHVIRYIC